MAIGLASDFKVYEEQINGAFIETLMQNTAAFNEASRGGITIRNNLYRGNYKYESYFQDINNLVTRRDTGSVAPVTPEAVTQEEEIAVKLMRKVGPVENTLDSWRKIMMSASEETMSAIVGTQMAKAMQVDELNAAIRSGVAGISGQGTNLTHTAAATLTTLDLVDGLAKFGDGASQIVIWIMHSKAYYDLVKDQININVTNVSDFNIATATPVTMNRPVIITDSPDLITQTSPTAKYATLGLVSQGIVVEESEEQTVHTDTLGGKENLTVQFQAEFTYSVGLRGMQWNVGAGGANPTDTALSTAANWTKVKNDFKSLPGFMVDSD